MTIPSLYELVGNLMTLKSTPETPLQEHFNNCAAQWSTMLDRAISPTGTTNGFGFHIHQIVNDAKCKAALLLLSVRHLSMQSVIDNLQTKEDLTYEIANHTLLAFVEAQTKTQQAEVLTANRTPAATRNTNTARSGIKGLKGTWQLCAAK